MRNTILAVFAVIQLPVAASAQFYTITKEMEIKLPPMEKAAVNADNKQEMNAKADGTTGENIITVTLAGQTGKARHDRKGDKRVYQKETEEETVEKEKRMQSDAGLPELTIPNLYREIIRNGIRHPKIVLAQAILETGWFRSNVCRNRNNLFGLTNPKTGKYYEFNHWTESVRAYYTKVQYKYKGGNYLLWLRDIGYAEDPNYIRAIISILKSNL